MFRCAEHRTDAILPFNLAGREGKLPGAQTMKTPPKPLPTIKAILDEHVTLTVECLDRLYLNGYIPSLQTEAGLVGFLTRHLQFGEGFIKICTYAPYPIKVCLNGHEWAKCQLQHQGIPFEALDNGYPFPWNRKISRPATPRAYPSGRWNSP